MGCAVVDQATPWPSRTLGLRVSKADIGQGGSELLRKPKALWETLCAVEGIGAEKPSTSFHLS